MRGQMLSNKGKVSTVEPTNVAKPKSNLPNNAKLPSVNSRTEATVNSAASDVPNNTVNQQQKFPCVFCSDSAHYSSQCPQYTTIKTCLDYLAVLGRRQQCAKKSHKKADCVVKLRDCRRCKAPHHHALCPKPLGQ